jgi:hypothetical protein
MDLRIECRFEDYIFIFINFLFQHFMGIDSNGLQQWFTNSIPSLTVDNNAIVTKHCF